MTDRVVEECRVRVNKEFLEKLCGSPSLGRIFMEVICYFTFGLEKEVGKILRDIMLDFYALCSSIGEAVMSEVTAAYNKRRVVIVSLKGCKLGSVVFCDKKRVNVQIECGERVYSYEMELA